MENLKAIRISLVQIPSTDSENEQFKEGQKLEAVDPLEMSRICPATVGKVRSVWTRNFSSRTKFFSDLKVLKNGYFMLSIDGPNSDDGSDCFCYHSSSRLIFPINFAKLNHIPLSPPYGYQGEFEWEKYLRETNSVYAPREIFQVFKVRKFKKKFFFVFLWISKGFLFLFLFSRKNRLIHSVSEWKSKPLTWCRRI